jgi:hypothetical protein
MRTLLLIVVSILAVGLWNARGQEARSLVTLQPSDWSVFEPDLDVNFEAQSQVVARRLLVEDSREGLAPFLNAEFSARAYFVALFQFDTSSDWAKHMLQLHESMTGWYFSVNGQLVQKQLDGSDCIDVTSLVDERGRAVVVFTRNLNKGLSTKIEAFNPLSITGISFRNIAIKQVHLNEDPFFGGKKIEVQIENFTSEAVDGKLVGRIYNADGSSLLIENNNCAYARANMEFSVDISLPESENLLMIGDYVVEVELLDKENAEQIVDAIQVPVKL